jgi:hypothetical protein
VFVCVALAHISDDFIKELDAKSHAYFVEFDMEVSSMTHGVMNLTPLDPQFLNEIDQRA